MCCGSESCTDKLLPWPTLAGDADADGPGLEPELEVEPELPAFAAKIWVKQTKRPGLVEFTNTAASATPHVAPETNNKPLTN